MKAILIAGATSGVGKTTIAMGIMGVVHAGNQVVQPFKVGPDYIDPSYHGVITGMPSRNLDTWMLPHQVVIELFHRAMVDKDIAIIEGVMGVYDGQSSTNENGSTAELAKLLGVPVILVVDSRNTARSIAAVVTGYKSFDKDLKLEGVILNGVGSIAHYTLCREAIEYYTGVKVLGYLPRSENLVMPERHLGLIPATEHHIDPEFWNNLIVQCQSTIDIQEILRIAGGAEIPLAIPLLFKEQVRNKVVKIAVAVDAAFSFYYQDNLDLLSYNGAEIVRFSPLKDRCLPEEVSGIYIGGGFPELFAKELEANEEIKRCIKDAVEDGMPVYAECGGLMYVGQSICDLNGNKFRMVGALEINSRIDSPKLSLGYRTVQAIDDGPVLAKGQVCRGHEFHWSVLDRQCCEANAYKIISQNGISEGFRYKGMLASYIHLHFGSVPYMASNFVEKCLQFAQRTEKANAN